MPKATTSNLKTDNSSDYWINGLRALVNLLRGTKKDDNSYYQQLEIANLAMVSASNLAKATSQKPKQHKFEKLKRSEIIENIIKNAKIEYNINIEETKNEEKLFYKIANHSLKPCFKVYYWRHKSVAVGIIEFSIKNNEWDAATLLIDNTEKDDKNNEYIDRDPYLLTGKVDPQKYFNNIFVDLHDHRDSHSDLRQLAVFYVSSITVKERTIIEGTYATVTQHEPKPIAGLMLLQRCSDAHRQDYIAALNHDEVEGGFEQRKIFLKTLYKIPAVISDFLYRKRLNTKGHKLLTLTHLPNYNLWDKLQSYKGLYKGYYVRTDTRVIEVFLLQFFDNGSAKIHMFGSRNYSGKYKWVPEDILTASFVYDNAEDHFHFRFILDGEINNSQFYGVFAGTDTNNEPRAGRVRIDLINENVDDWKSYESLLERIDLNNATNFSDLQTREPNLSSFFLGKYRPNYTAGLLLRQILSSDLKDIFNENTSSSQLLKNKGISQKYFPYNGDFEIFVLSRAEKAGENIYLIIKYPLHIEAYGGIAHLKGLNDAQVIGSSYCSETALSIQFNINIIPRIHTSFIFTISPLASPKNLIHAHGVCSWINPTNGRAEAAIAVLYTKPLKQDSEKQNQYSFDKNKYEEYPVGEREFFELEDEYPKLATFISGHLNRLVVAPSKPNRPIYTRHDKYRLIHFKAACFAGMKFNQSTDLQKKSIHKTECLDLLNNAFQHGFCDPNPQFENLTPYNDLDILLDELQTDGSLSNLITDVLQLCSQWQRINIINAWQTKRH